MKKSILAILLSLFFNSGFAQLEKLYKLKPRNNEKLNLELLNKLRLQQAPSIIKTPDNKLTPMPVYKPELQKKFVGPAKTGNELYVIEPYNMPCISPSKNYKSNMPVLGAKPVEELKPAEE